MKYFLNSCLLLLLFTSSSVIAASIHRQTLPALATPFPATDFSLQGENGKTYRLSDYHGKVIVLNFWATWCPPCRLEMPSLERLWQKVKGHGIVVLAVNVGEDSDTIFQFSGNYPTTFAIPMDSHGEVIKQYRVTGLPTTYIISPDGMVTHRAVGSREWDSAEMITAIKAELATKK